MVDERVIGSIQVCRENESPKAETSVDKNLPQAISDYLQWMISNGYAHSTFVYHEKILNDFLVFVSSRKFAWNDIFTFATLKDFEKDRKSADESAAIRGLSRYLFEQKRVKRPIGRQCWQLPDIYEQYLTYYEKSRQASYRKIMQIKKVLAAFHDYLEKLKINLSFIKIEQIDAFMAEFDKPFAPNTRRLYRSYLRGFLKYLYHQRAILRKDLAPLVVGAPIFAQAKPPKFLRPQEVNQFFDCFELSSPKDLRTYTMALLSYFLGLRPKEISLISLDDIFFSQRELIVKDRKSNNPIKLPLPENIIKAIAAYIVGGRPRSKHRRLFLILTAPYRPISPTTAGHHITDCMRKANLKGTAYWMRYTYAQNLLEAGASIYEIKEMMGHDSIESARKYLYIHIKLMRKVLFDEEL